MTAKRDREDRSTGPAKVVPATMMMIGLEKLAHLSCLPGVQMTVPHKHVVVITLVLRSQHTNIRIDIKELEGGVKATGVLCLLGIGVGLGSLLFYRIYSHLFPNTALPAPPSATGQKRQLFNKSKCLVCGRSSESRSPLHKRRAVAAAGTSGGEAVTMRGVPQGDTLSPQSDQGYYTEGGLEGCVDDTPISITPDSPTTVVGGLADIALGNRERRASQDSVVTRAQSWEYDDDVVLPVIRRCRAASSVVSEPTDISRPSTNRNSMYSSYSSSDQGFSSGAALDSFDITRSYNEMFPGRANLDLALQSITSPSHSNDSPSTTVMCSPLMRRHNHQRNLSSSSLTETNLKVHSRNHATNFMIGEYDDVVECGSEDSDMSEHHTDYHTQANMHSSPTTHMNNINNNTSDDVFTEITNSGGLRRNHYSFYSDIGPASDGSMKDYLLHRYSVDLGHNISGFTTPDNETLEGDEFGLKTVATMDKIQYELEQLHQDMEDMTEDVIKLNSEDLLESSPNNTRTKEVLKQYQWQSVSDNAVNKRSYKRRRSRSRSNSKSHSRDCSPESFCSDSFLENGYGMKESNSSGDFMWDYQSDLMAGAVHNRAADRFVAKRPCFRSIPSNMPAIATSRHNSDNVEISPSHSSCGSRGSRPRSGSCRSSLTSKPPSWEANSSWMVENVGRKYNLFEYAEKNWGDNGCDAKSVKKGLQRIPNLLGLSHLRPVRRDHYCLLRGVLYQVLVNRLPLHPSLASWKHVHQNLENLQIRHPEYLQKWTFANRLPYRRDQMYEHALECVQSLYEQMAVLDEIEDPASRENRLLLHLNAHPQLDLMLLEGCKLLMLLHAQSVYEDIQAGRATTLFARLLFSQDGATNPELLLKNYLNPLGDTMNMQRLHMYLLGHTMGVKIQVVQPSALSCNNFVAHYPDEGADSYPKIYLLQEAEGHYDVLST